MALEVQPHDGVAAGSSDAEANFCGCKRRRKVNPVDFAKWHITDFQWPDDGERGEVTEQNHAALRNLGAEVSEDSVDVMNIGSFLQLHEIHPDSVALAIINGMCSRVGSNNNEYRKTQGDLRVPPGSGPIACAFAALCASLPQATVIVTATGSGKKAIIAEARVRHTMTRTVVCREIIYPDPVKGVRYRPECNGEAHQPLTDPIPLGLVAVGPSMDKTYFGKATKSLAIGPLVLQAVANKGVLLFLGEFTCTSSLHLASYVGQMQSTLPREITDWKPLPMEMMTWGAQRYNYQETIRHCQEKLHRAGKSTQFVGMHAAQLWLYRSHELHVTHFMAGSEWSPPK